MPKKHQIGINLEKVLHIEGALREARDAGFDFICCGIVSEQHRQSVMRGEEHDATEPFSWFDLSLPGQDWNYSVTGVLSDLQQFTESSDQVLRERACKMVEKELGYAQHLAMFSTMVNLRHGDSGNLCRLLNSKVSNDGGNHSNILLWVRMPMVYDTNEMNGDANGVVDFDNSIEDGPSVSSWNTWNVFRSAGNSERRIMPALEIPLDLPSDDEITRWLGEPVKAIFLKPESFITNSKGYPILPKKTQQLVFDFFDIGSQVIINCPEDKTPIHFQSHKQYLEYLYGLRLKQWDEDPVIRFTKGYEDYLQSPLQPLMDNLESNTYEVFERDPTKYQLYEEAIKKALLVKIPEEEKETKTVYAVAMVVGAGRGPLVKNCLKAADGVDRKVKIYAVEKNVNAVCTLLHLKKVLWGDRVTVISCDMREWEPKEKADILISELLGSFGDNELSPECLDGAQKFLKDDGIMIPLNYTSYIAPVMSVKLHADVRTFFDMNKHMLSAYETPYVVCMKNFFEIARPKALFTFDHPKSNPNVSNDRYAAVDFTARDDAVLHGIAGYFESQLFDDVLMSIHPDTHSEGMFSWFPIYFPIRDPIQVKKGEKIKIHFWRCSNKHNVWYEWSISSPSPTYIHNANGRSYTIGL